MLSKRVHSAWLNTVKKEWSAWFSAVRECIMLDSALSKRVFYLNRYCPKECFALLTPIQKSVQRCPARRVFNAVQKSVQRCPKVYSALLSVVQKSVQLDSALSKRVFYLTQYCPKECFAWLSAVQECSAWLTAVQKSVLLDSQLSKRVFSAVQKSVQRCPKECSALCKSVFSLTQRCSKECSAWFCTVPNSIQLDSALLRR